MSRIVLIISLFSGIASGKPNVEPAVLTEKPILSIGSRKVISNSNTTNTQESKSIYDDQSESGLRNRKRRESESPSKQVKWGFVEFGTKIPEDTSKDKDSPRKKRIRKTTDEAQNSESKSSNSMETQTEAFPQITKADAFMMTDSVDRSNASMMTDAQPERTDSSMMTDTSDLDNYTEPEEVAQPVKQVKSKQLVSPIKQTTEDIEEEEPEEEKYLLVIDQNITFTDLKYDPGNKNHKKSDKKKESKKRKTRFILDEEEAEMIEEIEDLEKAIEESEEKSDREDSEEE